MHFSKIYIQDNFVPNVVEDPFRRKVIGIEVSLNEGESMADAKIWAEHYIQDYIKENIIYPDHNHIEERIIPDIQVEKGGVQVNYDVVIEEINKCQTIDDLDGWNLIAKGNHEAGMAFAKKAAFLLSPDNKKKQLQDEEVKQIMSKTNAASKLKQLKKLK